MEEIIIGSIEQLDRLTAGRRRVVIADATVWQLWGEQINSSDAIVLQPGEASKNFSLVENIMQRLIELRADRQTLIVGVGGGVVCDMAGFAASIFMRGVSFGLVPTTLLAQVDAALGGKNGVNVGGYKNMAGTFGCADFVLCDVSFLRTLPLHELLSGLAEVVKTAIVGDRELFELLEREVAKSVPFGEPFAHWPPPLWEQIVRRSAAVKMGIVARDRHESGERRLLNLGHTLGHAIEKVSSLEGSRRSTGWAAGVDGSGASGSVSHGFAVSVGTMAAARMAVERGMLPPKTATRIENLLKAIGLPTQLTDLPELDDLGMSSDELRAALRDAMAADKKSTADSILYILPTDIGQCTTAPLNKCDIPI